MQTRFTAAQLEDSATRSSEQILRKCVHCGFCASTCPTYVLLGDELDSPRGRIYLIKEMLEAGRPATSEVVRHLDRCLSCLACMTACPSGVNYQHLIDHARTHIERTYRRPLGERVLRRLLKAVLPVPGRLRWALRAARWGRVAGPLAPRRVQALFELAARAGALQPASRLARPAAAAATAARAGRVLLLQGCVQSVLAPATESAAVRLLERAGFEVEALEGCCGALVHHLGDADPALAQARALLARIEGALSAGELAAVIVTASGCGTQVKDYGFLFRDDPRWSACAARVSALTRDITEFLHEHAPPQPAAQTHAARGLTIAYHSACSMQHGQSLDRIPRELLARAGFDVHEVPEGHLCCGSAGTYNILQPQLASRLRARKLENLRRTRACVVAAGNVGCIVQLSGEEGLAVVHTAELLDWAAGGPEPAALGKRSPG
ncbi:MAG TPA: glycolate oxidase subunit GlcF [Steroidobacteraceae bacterium]|nr:glycolate oxidase subunit GlcF [Steroidobacteraceae bacterium]